MRPDLVQEAPPPIPGLRAQTEEEDGWQTLGLTAEKKKEERFGVREQELEESIKPPVEEKVDVDRYDPQAAFEEQAQRIADLVDRFEEFLRKLDEAVSRATGEDDPQNSLKLGFALNREAEEIVGVIESTATAILEEVKNLGDSKETKNLSETSRSIPQLNVVY